MFLEITKAQYLDNYRIKLLFNNGIAKTVDLANELTGSAFVPLKNIDNFKKFNIKYNTIEWENGADYAPEYLYKIGV